MQARSLALTHPLCLWDDGDAGAPYFIKAADTPARPLLWLEAAEGDEDHPHLLGNKLAEAVHRTANVQLFGYGMPWTYGIEVLRGCLDRLGPWVFALSGAQHAPQLARALLTLHDQQTVTILHATSPLPPATLYRTVTALTSTDLAVQPAELDHWMPDFPGGPEARQRLLRDTGGQMRPLLLQLAQALKLPPPLEPAPEGLRFLSGEAPQVEPDRLLDALIQRQRWTEALPLAARLHPHRVPELLTVAGPHFHERGLHHHLHALLSALPSSINDDPEILRWLYSAALRTGHARSVLPRVTAHLSRHEAPELRALHAGTTLRLADRHRETQRAAAAAHTPLTLYYHGLSTAEQNPTDALPILRAAVECAETEGTPTDVVRNVQALAATYTQTGQYVNALHWTVYALRQYDHSRMGDWQRRLAVLNEWAYTSLLSGRLEQLTGVLSEAETQLASGAPQVYSLFQTTLADHALVSGNPLRALRACEAARQHQPRNHQGWHSAQLVRVLTELDQPERALSVAEEAFVLTQHEARSYTRWSTLALGMARAYRDPVQAVPLLQDAMDAFEQPLKADTLVRAAAHLAFAHLQLGQVEQASGVMQRVAPLTAELGPSGRLLLGGPAGLFEKVWALLVPAQTLNLNLLGRSEVVWADQHLRLQPRHLEMLVLLSLSPEGLGGDRFASLLYRDEGVARSSLKAGISRLRQMVPVASQPYRLLVPVQADYLDVMALLQAGRVAEALRRYAGPLLPDSDAPGIAEYRELLHESLRQAVLSHRDPTLLNELAVKLDDDLEVWECALARLDASDPRRARAASRVRQLRVAYA
ncbi:hypothetical protein GCM10008960_01430 [Deinococcus sedimenti]|uniref:Uncharacterized protein n=2 Tax=Deinococcus sedimenti TaxID=1867090 RepID=A0ABQ2S205_9DEIO|nr:hypothetical protein GCM10008960_01430 [Deinococcus sedimenti]